MKMIKKIKNWLTGADKDAEIEELRRSVANLNEENAMLRTYYHDHDMVKSLGEGEMAVDLLEEVNLGGVIYRLYYAFAYPFGIFRFLIQLEYVGDQNKYFVRAFEDADIEYAENCARECFEYLTKEI